MDNKQLLHSQKDFTNWLDTYVTKKMWCDAERYPPEEYPCVIMWQRNDMEDSLNYGWTIDVGYVYLSDFWDMSICQTLRNKNG